MADRDLMTLMWAGIRGYRAEPKKPAILTDDELRAITVPVLLVTGAQRAHHPGAGPRPGLRRGDELNDRIVAFIKDQAASEQAAQPARPQAAEK